MGKQEYIIINKTAIQKRIEELEKANEDFKLHTKTHNPTMAACEATLSTLKQILSQSTPLIPEIEKAWEDGNTPKLGEFAHLIDDEIRKQDYISNLKLDI